MNDRHFQRLRLLLCFEISAFKERLSELRSAQYPSAVGPALIDALDRDLDHQLLQIETIVGDFPFDAVGAFGRLQSEHRKLVSKKLPYIRVIEGAQTHRVPWELIPAIERFAQALLSKSELLTTSVDWFNWAIEAQPLKIGVAEIDKFHLLILPSLHRSNAFLHVVIGHELFHPVVGAFLDQQQPAVLNGIKTDIDLLPKKPGLPLFDAKRRDQLVEAVRQVWRKAMEELMCDMGCAAIFGPAAILASWTLGLTTDTDAPPVLFSPNPYPPLRLRMREVSKLAFESDAGKQTIFDLLKHLRADPNLPELVASADRFEEAMELIRSEASKGITPQNPKPSDRIKIDNHEFLSVAYKYVDSLIKPSWDFVVDKLSHAQDIQPWSVSYMEVAHHLRNLRHRVPSGAVRVANEVEMKAGAIPAIAIAGWLYELYEEPLRSESNDITPDYLRSCRLILKSFQDAELVRDFTALKLKAKK